METVTGPASFRTLIAQDRAKELLQRSCRRQRLSHAYLFRGPAGVGKKQAALALAAAINCANPANQDACEVCPSCRKFRSGNHPDFLTVFPDGAAIKIKQIRALRQNLDFPPHEAQRRVVLLADVHTMRREAGNSLLKTLEEPPAHTILILTGSEAGAILPTILSRCQVIPFFALPYLQVAAALQAEGMPAAAATTLAAVAEGSLGRARLLAAGELLARRREIIERLLPLQAEAPQAVTTVFELAEQAAELKENLPELLALLQIWLRDLLLLAAGMPSSLVVSRDLTDLLAAAGCRWRQEQLLANIEQFAKARRYLQQNCNRALICEVLFFGLL
jgi:DNA polymerase III subunit delta'